MALSPLNERLDQLSAKETEATDAGLIADPISPELQPVPLVADTQEFEPTQVASLGGMLRKVVKGAGKKTERAILQEGVESSKIGPYQVIKEAKPQVGEDILQAAPTMPTTGKPSPSFEQVQAGVNETAFNLDMIKDEDGVKQFIEATARQYGADKLEKVSYKEIAQKASDEGYDEAFLARMINPNVETLANPTQAYKMLLAITDAGKRAFDLGEKVKAAKLDGTLDADLASQFQQAVALEGNLLKAARGRQADIARTLGIFSEARQSTTARGQMLDSLMTETGGIESVHDFATKYTALDSRGARAEMASSGYSNDIAGLGGRAKDMWFSTWINGLLSSPVTHAKNIAGNTFFGAYQIPERAVASAIGNARNFLFKGGEQAISLNEVNAQAIGFLQGIRDGGEIAFKAFKDNSPTDAFSKIEAGRVNRNPFDVDMGDSTISKAMSGALRYWGTAVTMPGRALMAEDEFFKAVGYRMELNALATREGDRMYSNLVKNGIDPDSAATQSANLVESLLVNPTDDIIDAAKNQSRAQTFTRELEPGLQKLQSMAQTPLLKMFVPFFKTPANITLEAMSRTPGLNLGSPRFWGDFNAGGVRRDMALARVTLGGALIYGAGSMALEGKLTGYGPMRNDDKAALEATGWQPFSFVLDSNNVSAETRKEFESMASVKEGNGKLYVSYAGLEPLSSLLSIASTSGEYTMMTPGGMEHEKIAMGGALGLYQYLSDQPMLQGFSEMTKISNSPAKDAPTKLAEFMRKATKQVSEFAIGGSPVGAYSSLMANVERIMNPEKSNTMPDQMRVMPSTMDSATTGFWEAVKYYQSRNPLTSDNLPRALDPITGEVKKVGKGNLYEAFSPFKTSDGKFSPAHATLIEYGIPMYTPDKSIDGIQLNATQYNRWIELATEDGRLEKAIIQLGDDYTNVAANDLSKAQAVIQKQISDMYSEAKQRLISEDPDLQDALLEVEQARRDYGKYKR